jgi:hypothetical protein
MTGPTFTEEGKAEQLAQEAIDELEMLAAMIEGGCCLAGWDNPEEVPGRIDFWIEELQATLDNLVDLVQDEGWVRWRTCCPECGMTIDRHTLEEESPPPLWEKCIACGWTGTWKWPWRRIPWKKGE